MGEPEKTQDDAVYQKQYYLENRERLLLKKADRYRKNPEYREAALRRSRERKQILKEEREKKRELHGRRRGPVKPKPFDVKMGSVMLEVVMMSGGQLAKRLGRKTQAIRVWEQKGILPEAMYRDPRTGARLYTEDQVKALVAAYQKAVDGFGRFAETRISRTSFPADAQEIWRRWSTGVAVS